MPKTVGDEVYLNTREAIAELGGSKKRFYSNAKDVLKEHNFDGKKTPWYRKRDVLAVKAGKPVDYAVIDLSGMQRDWTLYARSLGYPAETLTRAIEECAPLTEDVAVALGLPVDTAFVKRARMTLVHTMPICIWDTWYPMELVDSDMLTQIKQGAIEDIVKAIKEKHGVIISVAKDKFSARVATPEEQELLQLKDADPVLILYRASYTRGKRKLVLVQRMTLLSGWFSPEIEYEVHNWDE